MERLEAELSSVQQSLATEGKRAQGLAEQVATLEQQLSDSRAAQEAAAASSAEQVGMSCNQ